MSDPKCPLCGLVVDVPEAKPMTSIEDYIREYARLDLEATKLEELKSEANKKRDAVEQQIIERYNMEGMTTAKIQGLGSFSMTSMTRASIKADKKEEAIALFKSAYPDMVQETINAQTLSGFVNNAQKNDITIPEAILATLNVFKKQYLSWKR